jgi:hypothetical protein
MRASTLIEELRRAEKLVVDKINASMPKDSVPDRVAIPILNRLERQQGEAERAFCSVREWLQTISD